MVFDEKFWKLILGFLFFIGLSLFGYLYPALGNIIFFLTLLAITGVLIKRPEYTTFVVLAELALGGHGYLLRLTLDQVTVSFRIALFIIVCSLWAAKALTKPKIVWYQLVLVPQRLRLSYVGLLLLAAAGVIHGVARNDLTTVFFDANAWIFLLLPILLITTLPTKEQFLDLVQVLGAATIVIALQSLALLFWFGHALPGSLTVYQWIRDLRLGEISHVADTLYRIFMPSQLYTLVALGVVGTLLVASRLRSRTDLLATGAILYFASLTLLISQSRSFWLGAVAQLVILLVVAGFRYRFAVQRLTLVALLMAVVVSSQQSVIALVSGSTVGVGNRLVNIPAEPAGASRLNQLGPLLTAINQRPVLGSGFGATVTYQSRDPRILKGHPSGWYTTSAFELGYLDVALKIGLLGLAAMLLLIVSVLWLAFRSPRVGEWDATPVGWAVALLGVAVTHLFSPYLNHPLGFGVLAIAGLVVTIPAVTAKTLDDRLPGRSLSSTVAPQVAPPQA